VLKSFMMKLQARDAKERLAMEWRLVALALDPPAVQQADIPVRQSTTLGGGGSWLV